MSKTWCPLPWIHQDINTNGRIRVCCPSSVSKTGGYLKKEDGTLYNSAVDDLESARNSPTLKRIRSEMLKGLPPAACVRCRKEEAEGVLSKRLHRTNAYKNIISFEKAKELTDEDGTINPSEIPVRDYDLRLGNRCNLKCRMCGPTASDSWYSDFVKISGDTFKDSDGTKIKFVKSKNGSLKMEGACYDWFHFPVFWKQIKKVISDVRCLHIVGGEPLLIDKHYELLDLIVKHGSPNETIIEYNTNLTFLPKKAFEMWKRFKKILIGVSIDGYGPLNNYIRYPSRFERIEKNLSKIDQSLDNAQIWIATTVNAYNIFHLPDLIEWKLRKRFLKVNPERSDSPLIIPHLLHTPPFLSIKALPPGYKNQVKEKFDRFLAQFPDLLRELEIPETRHEKLNLSLQKLLNSYGNYMTSEDYSHLIPDFRKYTSDLDKIRDEKLQDVLPELHNSLRDYEVSQQ